MHFFTIFKKINLNPGGYSSDLRKGYKNKDDNMIIKAKLNHCSETKCHSGLQFFLIHSQRNHQMFIFIDHIYVVVDRLGRSLRFYHHLEFDKKAISGDLRKFLSNFR